MRHEKPLSFPLLMFKALRDRLTKRAIELDVNRSWLVTLYIDYGYRNVTKAQILQAAEQDPKSIPFKKLRI